MNIEKEIKKAHRKADWEIFKLDLAKNFKITFPVHLTILLLSAWILWEAL
jgi:hypothetical protein